MVKKSFFANSSDSVAAIFGVYDCNVRIIEECFSVKVYNRAIGGSDVGEICVSGESEAGVNSAIEVIKRISDNTGADSTVSEQTVEYLCNMVKDGELKVSGYGKRLYGKNTYGDYEDEG